MESIVDGPDSMRVMKEMIGSAKHYIHLSLMLYFNDKIGKLSIYKNKKNNDDNYRYRRKQTYLILYIY